MKFKLADYLCRTKHGPDIAQKSLRLNLLSINMAQKFCFYKAMQGNNNFFLTDSFETHKYRILFSNIRSGGSSIYPSAVSGFKIFF